MINIKNFVMSKTGVFVIGTVLLIIAMIIVLIPKKNKANCDTGEQKYSYCSDECGDICPVGQKWDCKKCGCLKGKKCGDIECCDNCNTDKKSGVKFCCEPDQFCPTASNPNRCCTDDQKCSGNMCLEMCQVGGTNLCDEGDKCMIAEGLSEHESNDFKKDFSKSACVKKSDGKYTCNGCGHSKCKTTLDKSLPGLELFPMCTDIFQTTPDGSDVGYCASDQGTSYDCSSKSQKDCTGKCTFKSVFSTPFATIQKDIEAGKTPPKGAGYIGNWCGQDMKYILQTSEDKTSDANCSAFDCWDQLTTKPGIKRVKWDEDKRVCTAIGDCDTNTPSPFVNSNNCIQEPLPSECSNLENNSCSGSGEVSVTPKTARWFPTGVHGDNFKCVPKDIDGGFVDLSTCIKESCSTDNLKCCAAGYTINPEDGKCYQNPFIRDTAYGNNICSANDGGICQVGTCKSEGGYCGAGWTQYNTGSCAKGTCSVGCGMGVIPEGYTFCSKSKKKWDTCTTKGGCNGVDWGSLVKDGGRHSAKCIEINDETPLWAKYCRSPFVK
jgi:hypothetical protein